jgi:hypothetical protein
MKSAPRPASAGAGTGRRARKAWGAYSVKAHEQRLAEALLSPACRITVAGIISGASGAGFVKQGDPIAVREMSTNAAALSPRKLRFDSPFSRASFSSPAGALARSGGNAQKRGRTSIPPRRRSNIYLVFKVFW